jgi:hypothetical protein
MDGAGALPRGRGGRPPARGSPRCDFSPFSPYQVRFSLNGAGATGTASSWSCKR